MPLEMVSSLGMVTNLGRDVRTACAAARAGLSRFGPLDDYTTYDPDLLEAPVTGGAIAGFTDGFASTGMFVRLAHAAVEDLIAYGGLPPKDNKEFWRGTGLVWCLPEVTFERFMWPEDGVAQILQFACAERLSDVSELPLAISPGGQLPYGHVGAADALSRIDALAAELGAERVLLIATDSFIDELAIRVLLSQGRVKSAENPAGLIPGEAGAAILLEDGAAPSSACGPQCRILGAAALEALPPPADEEDVRVYRRHIAPAVGRNLATVVTAVLDQAALETFTGTIFLDLNGEEWKAVAWGLAVLQLERRISPEQTSMEYPCVSFGEIGAASALTALCLSARGFVSRYSAGDHALVLSIGDGGQVSAILAQAAS